MQDKIPGPPGLEVLFYFLAAPLSDCGSLLLPPFASRVRNERRQLDCRTPKDGAVATSNCRQTRKWRCNNPNCVDCPEPAVTNSTQVGDGTSRICPVDCNILFWNRCGMRPQYWSAGLPPGERSRLGRWRNGAAIVPVLTGARQTLAFPFSDQSPRRQYCHVPDSIHTGICRKDGPGFRRGSS